MRESVISSAEAINEALAIMGARDKNVLLFGEGIDDPSAVFGTTKGLRDIYGDDRIIEMPVSENGLCGVAIGAAMSGKRPVIALHRVEFALLAMEQIINNAAKMHYISNGQHMCPLVIRLVVGRGWGNGPSHTQSLETLFAYIPGLKVIAPCFPSEYKGLLLGAIEDNNPVVILETRWSHYIKGDVLGGYYTYDISRAVKERTGQHVTIATYSYNVGVALKAAEILQEHGIMLEVINLRSLRPLDIKTVRESVQHTGRLITIDLGYKTLGIGAELVAECAELLKQAPVRMGIPDHPIPSSKGYLRWIYPDVQMVVGAVCKMMDMEAINMPVSDIPIDVPDPSFQGPF